MNSSLLNIWRENGAYLRYGDAKSLFFLGLSSAALFSLASYLLAGTPLSWGFLRTILIVQFGSASWLSLVFFLLALLVSAASIIPTLSSRAVRVQILIGIGEFFAGTDTSADASKLIYFRDIARYGSSTRYCEALINAGVLTTEPGAGNVDLTEQIWIVSSIAYAKFVAVNLSILFLLLGTITALLTI